MEYVFLTFAMFVSMLAFLVTFVSFLLWRKHQSDGELRDYWFRKVRFYVIYFLVSLIPTFLFIEVFNRHHYY
ncbi:putative membrane protein [Desulfitispora alkaliphila]